MLLWPRLMAIVTISSSNNSHSSTHTINSNISGEEEEERRSVCKVFFGERAVCGWIFSSWLVMAGCV